MFLVKDVYDKYDFHNKPCHIFNCDESGFQCDCGKMKIVCRRSCKNPKKLGGSNEKVMYTVLSCCNSIGEFLPNNIIFKGKRLMSNWCINGPKNATYDMSDSGWMEGAQFSRWFKLVFLEHTKKLEGHKLLFLDGHASHITNELISLARDNKVILFRLPAHTYRCL